MHALPLNLDETALISILSVGLTITYRSLRYVAGALWGKVPRLARSFFDGLPSTETDEERRPG